MASAECPFGATGSIWRFWQLCPSRTTVGSWSHRTRPRPKDSSVYGDTGLELFPVPSRPRWQLGFVPLWRTRSGALWLATDDGLQRWDGRDWAARMTVPSGSLDVRRVVEDAAGNALAEIASPEADRGVWASSGGAFRKADLLSGMGTIQTMDIGPEGDVFVVNRLGDIQVRDGEEWSWVVPSLPQMNDVQLLKIGADGDIWGATDEGVSFFNRSSSLWTVWKQPGVDARNDILEIVRARDGSVWIGTGGGVEVRKPDGTIEWTDQIEDTAVTSVTAVAEDERGNIWIGSGNAFPGAFRWDGQRWQHFGVAEGLPVSAIHKIRTDSRGRLWFLGLDLRSGLPLSVADGPGAFLYTDDQFVRWGQEEGLPSGRVYAFAEAPDGAYWFGTLGGLSRWARGVWTHWTVAEGLVRNRIFALAVDPEGTVWFSHQTSGNGLGYLDGDRPRYLTTEDGLPSDRVWDIRPDPSGRLWVTTNAGLAVSEGVWSPIIRNHGLETEDLWPVLPLEDRRSSSP